MRIPCFLLLSTALIAQSNDYSLSGTVLNSQTGEPIKNALITLTQMPGRMGLGAGVPRAPGAKRGQLISKTTFSGLAGEFSFTGLEEGQYLATALKPQFIPELKQPSANGITMPDLIELKSSMTDVRLRLSPLGVIEGQVVDQFGEPVRGANIMAISIKIDDGLQTTHTDRSVATNDQGRYRLWNLSPGKYYIKAAGRSGGTYSYVGDSATLTDSWEAFAPVYAGGAHEMESATPVAIAPGSDARADFAITREPAMRIHGTLANFAQLETVTFELLRGKEDVSNSRVSLNATTGRFEILNVTPGSYVLRAAQGKKSRGETAITVNRTDVDGVSLMLAPAGTVKILTQVLGQPPEELRQIEPPDGFRRRAFSFCQVRLSSPVRNATPLMGRLNPGAEETTIENVLPGEYRVSLQCNGGYPTSAMLGSHDLLANPYVRIDGDSTIEISLKLGGGSLAATLDVKPMPADPSVLLVPNFAASTGPVLMRAASLDMDNIFEPGAPRPPGFPTGSGQVTMANFLSLAPGNYTAYALSTSRDVEFREPAFLQSLRGGIPVQIDESSRKTITLTDLVK